MKPEKAVSRTSYKEHMMAKKYFGMMEEVLYSHRIEMVHNGILLKCAEGMHVFYLEHIHGNDQLYSMG